MINESLVPLYLFDHILNPREQPRFSAISDQEKQRALEILQGVFLLHPPSKDLVVAASNGIKVRSPVH
jgi:hypothetical protein